MKPKYHYYYNRLPETLKTYSRRLSKLQQEVSEMRHYWKIRCTERKTLTDRNQKIRALLLRMETLAKNLGEMFNRKRFVLQNVSTHKTKNEECYPLFISHHEYTRLRYLLRRRRKRRKK